MDLKKVYRLSNVFTPDEISSLLQDAKKELSTNFKSFDDEETQDVACADAYNKTEVINRVQATLKEKLNVFTTCYAAQYQVWKEGTQSEPHVHDEGDRSQCDYNTMIYLNDDYDGGEFYTLDGKEFKPNTGDVTFFNGELVWHGVRPVKNKDRYTMIIWWLNTKENNE